MATRSVFKDATIYSGGYDLSGASNTLGVEYAYDEVDATCFGDGCRYSLPGLAGLSFDLQGHAASDGTDESDDVLWGRLSTQNVPMSFSYDGGDDGEVAYFCKSLETSYSAGGTIGEMYAFTATGSGSNYPLVRGRILGTGSKTSTANGTARELGAVSSTQYLYTQMHILAVSGTSPTLDVIIESDDAEGFSSGTTRATFTQANAVGSEALTRVSGAITDTWWRAAWTIGGSDTPTFSVVIVVGIQ